MNLVIAFFCKMRFWLPFGRRVNRMFFLLAFLSLVCRTVAFAANGVDLDRTPVVDKQAPYNNPTNGLGSWIWADRTFDGQTCQFWKNFEIPSSSPVVKARLRMTADNEFVLFFDGRKLGRGAEWRDLFDIDLTALMSPGRHVLAVSGYNSASGAGMILGLQVILADGQIIEIKSDQSWRIIPEGTSGWEKTTEASPAWPVATIVGALGIAPRWAVPQSVNVMPVFWPVKIFFWQTEWFQIMLLSICGAVILISFRLMGQLALHKKERWLLRQERARIAREIHDDIGARMTQIVLHGEMAQSGLPADSETQLQLVYLCEEARGLLSAMDEILWAVNPRRDTLRDFVAYVCQYAEEFLKPTQIQCLFEVDPEMGEAIFELPFRRSLFMAIKETLNNAVKHSEATELRLQIKWQGRRLAVVVQDNGKGFDPKLIDPECNGFTNITRRMSELGGSLRVVSQPGQGCRIEFGMPFKQPRRRLAWSRLWNPKQFLVQNNEANNLSQHYSSQNHDPAKT
jgi:signal transduction histidine kinase